MNLILSYATIVSEQVIKVKKNSASICRKTKLAILKNTNYTIFVVGSYLVW